jgi:dolichyl-phosphate beta-glucosyltransferase
LIFWIRGIRGALSPCSMTNPSRIHLSVIIPAYNEELRLPHTLGQAVSYLKAQPYASEVIVVNDGSTDGTERVVRDLSPATGLVRLIAHPDGANHGKGASVKVGMLHAEGEYRLFMDADNSTTLNQVESFWPFFTEGYGVIIGSRALEASVIGQRQARYKELAGRMGNWMIRKLAVPGIRDTQAGFKMLTGKDADRIFPLLTIDGWGYDIEMLAVARSLGCRIREVPITWINASGSKVRLSSYFEVLGDIWRIRRNVRAGCYR